MAFTNAFSVHHPSSHAPLTGGIHKTTLVQQSFCRHTAESSTLATSSQRRDLRCSAVIWSWESVIKLVLLTHLSQGTQPISGSEASKRALCRQRVEAWAWIDDHLRNGWRLAVTSEHNLQMLSVAHIIYVALWQCILLDSVWLLFRLQYFT